MSSNETPENGSHQDEPSEADVVQRLERSLNFWVTEKEDYPPAIRGVVAHRSDLREDVQELVRKIGRDSAYPDLILKRVLWFEDKNEKLDEASKEARIAFRPYKTTDEGLISWKDPNNPILETPTVHRLVVSDDFASTNYDRPSEDMVFDESEDDDDQEEGLNEVKPNSWKRKITQTLKPWRIQQGDKITPARDVDDLLLSLNMMLSRTKHGWLTIDLLKLKKRRGAMLTYARTFEYQIKNDQRFEFMLQLFGAATVYRKRLAETLSKVACVYLEAVDGEIYVTKVSTYQDSVQTGADVKQIVIPLEARVVHEDGKPSQLALKQTGKYFESKLRPLVEAGKKVATKIDLRKSNSEAKHYRFNLKVELDGPLLIASSGDAAIFQLNDMLTRFCETNLTEIRNGKAEDE
jgi:hypothetical protein